LRNFIVFLHLLGAIWMGIYLLFPFLAMRLADMSAAARAGFAGGLGIANRWGQILLLAQFVTGGYLVGRAGFSTAWIITVIALLVLIGAFTGMMGKPLKQLKADNLSGSVAGEHLRKITLFSWIVFALFLIMIILMYFPYWF